jgi:hypothetical protein
MEHRGTEKLQAAFGREAADSHVTSATHVDDHGLSKTAGWCRQDADGTDRCGHETTSVGHDSFVMNSSFGQTRRSLE